MKSYLVRNGLRAAFIVPALFLSTSALAGQGSAQDTVISQGNQVVVSTDGNCVRTKWMASSDACGRPAPVKVVAPSAQKIELEQRTVYFDFNKSTFTATEKTKLDKLVAIIKNSKSISHATVVGYTDDIGKNSYNMKLSQKRAEVVEKYLAAHVAIPTSVLMVGGKGDSDPVVTCSPKMKRAERITCLAQDRRVEIKFDYTE